MDTGSEVNLISASAVQRLNLDITYYRKPAELLGVGGSVALSMSGYVVARVAMIEPFPELTIKFRIVPQVSGVAPPTKLPRTSWPHLEDLQLADTAFDTPAGVDIILGTAVCAKVLSSSKIIRSKNGSPIAVFSKLGWLVLGGYSTRTSTKRVRFDATVVDNEGKSTGPPYRKGKHIHSGTCNAPQNDSTCIRSKPSRFEGEEPSNPSSWTPLPQRVSGPGFRYSANCQLVRPLAPPSVCTLRSSPATIIEPYAKKNHELASLLEKLFELEKTPETSPLTPDETKAEQIFSETTIRDRHGRFVVALPLKEDAKSLGQSRDIASRHLFSLERRLRKKPDLRIAYHKFMQDYLESGHMSEVTACHQPTYPPYYLPHHCVHRQDDPPEKIRVVFNASQPTSNGLSLNDILLSGPKLQTDIVQVIARFRYPQYVFTADIRQMFRQILHGSSYRDLLRILWRFDEMSPIREFQLNTVTYGTRPAPYLAIRVLRQLSDEARSVYPAAAETLEKRTYVDDIHDGGNTIAETLNRRDQLINCLISAGFELRKWAANDPAILEGIPENHLLPSKMSLSFDQDSATLKVLGLGWDPQRDVFAYTIKEMQQAHTKRDLLSQMARIFDPLGWLAPISLLTKVLFRECCQYHVGWDDPMPNSIRRRWVAFQRELPIIRLLQIPRHLPIYAARHALVGFSDASEKAYAAVLYLHIQTRKGEIHNRILAAKSRVSPLKPISLPRLELCAAQLLGRLYKQIYPSVQIETTAPLVAFSDSTVALSWLTADPPHTWKVFVGNRVAETLQNIPATNWYHVSSHENPADCASRGITPAELHVNQLWWHGPQWMASPIEHWPLKKVQPLLCEPEVISERKPQPMSARTNTAHISESLEQRFSSFARLRNVVAYCRRFCHNYLHRTHRRSGPLTAEELHEATSCLIRRAQRDALREEVVDAERDRPKLNLVRRLGVFIDPDGILRVGGRIQQACLPFTQRHPALLPSKHQLTALIIDHAHTANLHVGPNATHAYLRRRYWIVNGKNVVRRQLLGCNKCFSLKPKPYQPPMGQLPRERLEGIVPFHTTGVDYAGPFTITAACLRGARTLKAYMSFFICFATKAVHIEISSNLSTPVFLAAYRRFVARRGHPRSIWSDNGTNFTGANAELRRLASLLGSSDYRDAITTAAASYGTTWNFIPPDAPHFGGLWEAAVKSAKRLLFSILKGQLLTFEEFSTLAAQIEAVLNSRPITALSTNTTDIECLTPGHFLIFRPLTAPPDEKEYTPRTACKTRWTQIQAYLANFWRRWQNEYLIDQQVRTKWNTTSKPAKKGDIVIIMDDNTKPIEWKLGRIREIYSGPDGVARVADVDTASGTLRRTVRKLCPLPTQ